MVGRTYSNQGRGSSAAKARAAASAKARATYATSQKAATARESFAKSTGRSATSTFKSSTGETVTITTTPEGETSTTTTQPTERQQPKEEAVQPIQPVQQQSPRLYITRQTSQQEGDNVRQTIDVRQRMVPNIRTQPSNQGLSSSQNLELTDQYAKESKRIAEQRKEIIELNKQLPGYLQQEVPEPISFGEKPKKIDKVKQTSSFLLSETDKKLSTITKKYLPEYKRAVTPFDAPALKKIPGYDNFNVGFESATKSYYNYFREKPLSAIGSFGTGAVIGLATKRFPVAATSFTARTTGTLIGTAYVAEKGLEFGLARGAEQKGKVIGEAGAELTLFGLGTKTPSGLSKLKTNIGVPVYQDLVVKSRLLRRTGSLKANFEPTAQKFQYVPSLRSAAEFTIGKQGEITGLQMKLTPLKSEATSSFLSEQAQYVPERISPTKLKFEGYFDPLIDIRKQTRLTGFGAKAAKIKPLNIEKLELNTPYQKRTFLVTERGIEGISKRSTQLNLQDYGGVPSSVARSSGLFDVPISKPKLKLTSFRSKKGQVLISNQILQERNQNQFTGDYYTKNEIKRSINPIDRTTKSIAPVNVNLNIVSPLSIFIQKQKTKELQIPEQKINQTLVQKPIQIKTPTTIQTPVSSQILISRSKQTLRQKQKQKQQLKQISIQKPIIKQLTEQKIKSTKPIQVIEPIRNPRRLTPKRPKEPFGLLRLPSLKFGPKLKYKPKKLKLKKYKYKYKPSLVALEGNIKTKKSILDEKALTGLEIRAIRI